MRKSAVRIPIYILPCIAGIVSLTFLFFYQVDRFASRTKTVAGHNLDPTPWHIFAPRKFDDESRPSRAYKIIQCSYLTCGYSNTSSSRQHQFEVSESDEKCPEFFRFIHQDLEPWKRTGITAKHVMEAKKFAAFRVVIYQRRLYLDLYYACVQSRMMFTIWGLLQILNRYPGKVPDVDIMFDCMDKPVVNKAEYSSMPLPLFRYCTTKDHFDIPFPDWSFWGWSEINIRPWNEEFPDIKRGSESKSWGKKLPQAFWKGNPDVMSPIRTELLKCNNSRKWGAHIMRQDWNEEAKGGFKQSKLSDQCNYRYKIYAEGYAWSVSLKYILSCGSLSLIISPKYEDFYSRGLIPSTNYWSVSSDELCQSIKFAVDWGNSNPSEARAIGKAGQDFMESLSMGRVYDYMFHLINEYSKLQKFKPVPPSSANEVCADSLLCFADQKQKDFLVRSAASPSRKSPCDLQPADGNVIKS